MRGTKTNKEYGRVLEEYVAQLFRDLGIDEHARPTKASGAKGEAGDVQQKYFVVECKARETKDAKIVRDVWVKNKDRIPLSSKRMPLLVVSNNEGRKWAVLDLDEFMHIFKKSLEAENGKES